MCRCGASRQSRVSITSRELRLTASTWRCPASLTMSTTRAIAVFFDYEHDMVVSGVNDGANLGDDVLYSGTVAAAIEGRFLGLPTLAVSLCTGSGGGGHFATGAEVARILVAELLRRP